MTSKRVVRSQTGPLTSELERDSAITMTVSPFSDFNRWFGSEPLSRRQLLQTSLVLAASSLGPSPVARNATAMIDWRFTTKDARIKLKRLYPVGHP